MQGLEPALLRSRPWAVLMRWLVVPWVLSFAKLPDEAKVLELGFGAGFDTEALAERFPGWRIVASDFDPEMVELARQRVARFADRVSVRQGDASALPFDESSFDVVIALHVWHHVGDWEEATCEARRVLRPGGSLVLMDLLEASFPAFMRKLFPPKRTYELEELRSAFADAGFSRWRLRAHLGLVYRAVAIRGE